MKELAGMLHIRRAKIPEDMCPILGEDQLPSAHLHPSQTQVFGWLGHVVTMNGWVEVWVVAVTVWCNVWHRARGPYVSIGRHWFFNSMKWKRGFTSFHFRWEYSRSSGPLFILKTATEQPNFCLFSNWIQSWFYIAVFSLNPSSWALNKLLTLVV